MAMKEALAHVSLEPEAHDSGWLFHTREGLLQALLPSTSSTSPATEYDFNDPALTLRSADARKCWNLAPDHNRDVAGGNSAHMLAVYRLFSGCDQASFDVHSGVDTPLPLGLFLSLGCMLVVVVQTEGTVVYVPSASGNESAHVVTTAADRAGISVAGNMLSPRHSARLIRQHEEDGPPEAVRLEWAHTFAATSSAAADSTEQYAVSATCSLPVPTAAAINDVHAFLSGVVADDGRYQPEFYRQSWIPDLFSTAQLCRILSEAVDRDTLPKSMVVEQLLDAGRCCPAMTRAVLAALSVKAAETDCSDRSPSWHLCSARLGCPGHVGSAAPQGCFQRVHSIRRPPLLLTTALDTRAAQEDLVRHVHQGITQGAVVCNSLVPVASLEKVRGRSRQRRQKTHEEQQQQQQQQVSGADRDDVVRPYEFKRWAKSQSSAKDTLTVRWMQDALRDRRAVYLTDIAPEQPAAPSAWKDKADAMLRGLLGDRTATGFLLRHCAHHSPGVHSPSFFALFCPDGGQMTSPHHNESHRVAAWHLLLRHPKPASDSMVIRTTSPAASASPSALSAVRASADSISLILQCMAAKSDMYAGSDHMLDDIDPEDSSRRQSSARDLYAGSVSLAFGELTEDSSWRVVKALAMTSASRLLDIGSAFGRFCVHAALAAPAGVCVTGIEVGIKRAQLAAHFLDELTREHSAILAPVRPNLKLIHGDIVRHLPELFAHSHVFLFDARFVESTWHILAHLLSYLSSNTDPVVISCQPLHKCNPDLVCGEPVSLRLSGGGQKFTAHVYRVCPKMRHRHAVEVFESPVHGLGVRAVRALRVGQTIMRVVGELVHDTTFAQLTDASKRGVYPYLTRTPSLDKLGKRAFMHAFDVCRYINSREDTPHKQNVALRTVNGELCAVAVREIGRGEELLSDYCNWTTTDQPAWQTDAHLTR